MRSRSLVFVASLLFSGVASAMALPNATVPDQAAPALMDALIAAGAIARGPSQISTTVLVENVGCSGGYNQFSHRAESNCSFVDGTLEKKVDGKLADALLSALINAKLIQHGPAEMTAGSVRSISCNSTTYEGAVTVRCDAEK